MGLTCSGKTTTFKKFADDYGYDYISPDDIRMEICGDIKYQTEQNSLAFEERNRKIWNEVKKRLKESLLEGHTAVIDSVFNDIKKRKEFLDFARENGADKIQGVYIDTSLEVAKERNCNRERHVPEEVIEKISLDFEENRPKNEEGFDSMFTLDEYQKLVDAEIKTKEGELRKQFNR